MDTDQFTGSAEVYRHALARSVVYTEGAQYVAETAGAYWLLDKVAIVGSSLRDQPFQVWKLDVAAKAITVDDGNGNVIHTEQLDFTDFPEPGVTLWLCDGTIMVPSEY